MLVVGAGQQGQVHLKAWSKQEGVRLVAVTDPDLARAERAGKEYGIAYGADYRAWVADPAVQVVSVCTPVNLHPEVAIAAARAGKHVMTEKPLALTLEDADRMAEEARRHGVLLSVTYMRRFNPAVQRVRDWIRDGRLGRPLLLTQRSGARVRPKVLMHSRSGNGGPVIDTLGHTFDLWRWMLGSDPVAVCAQGFVLAEGKPELASIRDLAVDTAQVTVRFASGDVGSVVITWGLPANVEGFAGDNLIIGPSGYLQASGEFTDGVVHTSAGRESYTVPSGFQDWFDTEMGLFLQAIRTGGDVPVSFADARMALAVSLAALASVEQGGAPVRVGS